MVAGSNVGAPVCTEAVVPNGGGVTNAERLTRLAVRDEEQARCGGYLCPVHHEGGAPLQVVECATVARGGRAREDEFLRRHVLPGVNAQ